RMIRHRNCTVFISDGTRAGSVTTGRAVFAPQEQVSATGISCTTAVVATMPRRCSPRFTFAILRCSSRGSWLDFCGQHVLRKFVAPAQASASGSWHTCFWLTRLHGEGTEQG